MRINLSLKFFFLLFALFLFLSPQAKAQTWMDEFKSAMTAVEKGDFEEAIVHYEKALPGVKEMFGENSEYYSLTLNQLAQLYEFTGRNDKAEQLFLLAVSIAKNTVGDKHLDYAKIIGQLAVFYRNINQNEKAEELFLESAFIYKTQLGEGDPQYAKILGEMGLLYSNMGQYEKTESLYLIAAEIIKTSIGTKTEEYASCIMNQADLYAKTYEYLKAEALFKQAIAIRKEVLGENDGVYASSVGALAHLYMKAELYDKAEPLLLQCLQLQKKSLGEMHPQYATTLFNLAAVYNNMHNYVKAEEYYLQSLELTKKVQGENHSQYAIGLSGLGDLYSNMGELEKAEKYYIESLGILKKALGPLHNDYEIGLSNLATFYTVNNQMAKAELCYQEIEKNVVQNIHNNFEFLSETEKEKYGARVFFNFEIMHGFYYHYYQQKKNVGKWCYNIQLTSRGMILNSENQVRSTISNSGDTALIRLHEKWKAIKTTLANQYSKPIDERNPNLKKWEEECNGLEKELIKKSKNFANDQHKSGTTWNDIQSKLKANEAAIEFVSFNYHNGIDWTDSVLYVAIVINKSDSIPVYIPLFEERQLSGLLQGDSIRTFANLLYTDAQVRTVEHDISYGDSLYKLIWQPLEPNLKNVSTIYFAPAGLLHNLNLDAIPNGNNTMLSDKYNLHRLTTTSITTTKESVFNPTSISLFGGINYEMDETELKKLANKTKKKENLVFASTRSEDDSTSRSGFNYLPGSKAEVDNINSLFGKTKISTKVYSDNGGTEEAVKNLDGKNSPSFLHFSTHGFFFPDPKVKKPSLINGEVETVFKYSDNPLFRSGLIMAGADFVWKGNKPIDGIEDGILTSYEISDLYLTNTKLVVMSACETGLGEIKGSEGVYGLQRAFKMAGTEYIIMTLWKVLDKETSEFMTKFYQHLLDKKSIPAAFKMAQDEMKYQYRNEPYKWAAFVLIK